MKYALKISQDRGIYSEEANPVSYKSMQFLGWTYCKYAPRQPIFFPKKEVTESKTFTVSIERFLV